MKTLKCKATFINLEGGFWGLIDEEGTQYLPVNMHEQLKSENLSFTVRLEPLDVMGMAMWGTPVKIISFTTS